MAVCLEHGLPVELAMLLGIVVGMLAGLVNGLIVVYAALPSLVVTIGTLALYPGNCADHPQRTRRKRISGMVSKHWVWNDRQHPDPMELV